MPGAYHKRTASSRGSASDLTADDDPLDYDHPPEKYRRRNAHVRLHSQPLHAHTLMHFIGRCRDSSSSAAGAIPCICKLNVQLSNTHIYASWNSFRMKTKIHGKIHGTRVVIELMDLARKGHRIVMSLKIQGATLKWILSRVYHQTEQALKHL